MKRILFLLFTTLVFGAVQAQFTYEKKVEVSTMRYQFNTIQIEAGPSWQGYYLDDDDGIDVSFINGLTFKQRLFGGVGLSYVNFEGTQGLSLFSDVDLYLSKWQFQPYLSLRLGYMHIWNQYEGGRGTALSDFGFGVSYSISPKLNIYLQSGFLMTQQSLLIPLRLGFKF